MLDTTIATEGTDEIAAPQWVNLWFLKNGRSCVGNMIFPTKADALSAAEYAWASFSMPGVYFARARDGVLYPVAEISHHMQVPWTDRSPKS